MANSVHIRKEVVELIDIEHMSRLAERGSFVDMNQAESVINGELWEAELELETLKDQIRGVTFSCRTHDRSRFNEYCNKAYGKAVAAIEELIQVAAMCRKAAGMPEKAYCMEGGASDDR